MWHVILDRSHWTLNILAFQVWVLDSVIGAARAGKEEPTDVKRVLEVVEKIPLPIESRQITLHF